MFTVVSYHGLMVQTWKTNLALAQIATYVKEARKAHPDLILVDIGDAIQDNQVEVFAKTEKYYKDNPVPKVLNAMLSQLLSLKKMV